MLVEVTDSADRDASGDGGHGAGHSELCAHDHVSGRPIMGRMRAGRHLVAVLFCRDRRWMHRQWQRGGRMADGGHQVDAAVVAIIVNVTADKPGASEPQTPHSKKWGPRGRPSGILIM